MSFAIVKPVIDFSMRSLCRKPYPNHPKGCPNYRRKSICPTEAKIIHDLLNLEKPVHAIFNQFDLGSHVEKMFRRHPEWSQRQLVCCLYWQGKARKQLRKQIEIFLNTPAYYGLRIIECPEATGINLTETMKQIGVELEWPPVKWTYQIVLAGQWK